MALKRRPVVLTIVDHYLPGFRGGGPIRTVENMVERLSGSFDFHIIAGDRDLGDTRPYEGVAVNAWNTVGSAQVFYRSPGASGWHALLRDPKVREHDLLYLTGIFNPNSSLRPLMYLRLGRLRRTPVLLAPRGQLSHGALRIRRAKKRVFMQLVRWTGFFRNLWWHCSNAQEANELRTHFRVPPDRILIAPDLSGFASEGPATPARRGEKLKIAFLSRVAPNKNLDGALKILSMVRKPVEFEIFGPIEDVSHWRHCKRLIERMPANVSVEYGGEVRHDRIEATLQPFDLFLFPTHGENYGHVIREALSSGLPVLLSENTPWRDLEAKGAGADLPLHDLARFARWIDDFGDLDDAERGKMRSAARALGNDAATAAANLEANKAMLETAIGANGGSDPG